MCIIYENITVSYYNFAGNYFKFLQVIGALLGTQNGRDVEIVNSFDIATTAGPGRDLGLGEAVGIEIDQGFLAARKEQCAPSWSFQPRARHFNVNLISLCIPRR